MDTTKKFELSMTQQQALFELSDRDLEEVSGGIVLPPGVGGNPIGPISSPSESSGCHHHHIIEPPVHIPFKPWVLGNGGGHIPL